MKININKSGFIESIKNNQTKKEYCPNGQSSALLSLTKDKKVILPISSEYNAVNKQLILTFPNGSVATMEIEQKDKYLRFQLTSLSNRNGIDNIVWGPYKTNISKTIGEIISVVRDDKFAIGLMALNDNTTSGPPCDGDMYQLYYYIHSPDPAKYLLPAGLREGQTFRIGGNGVNDVAFYSHPEEYYRLNSGNGALLEPTFGSSITMHSRDRRKPQLIYFTFIPGFEDVNAPRHQIVDATDADFIGSAVAFYGCPDTLGLNVIENIVLAEGLPHPTMNGKWIKDPTSYQPDIAWSGTHDSLISYTKQLGLKAIQDEGLGEYYINPAVRWANKKINISGKEISIKEFTRLTNKEGIAYGLHTLCEFTQPHSSNVSPIPNDSLCVVLRTTLTKNINPQDTLISVTDTSYLNERGCWHDNQTNVLKLERELITYKGVTTTKPYTLTGIKRGAYKTTAMPHKKGNVVAKLQVNCYHGFIPNMSLQDKYTKYYARLLRDGGMNYIDFDGLESCIYQGHGQYSFKRFFRNLFDKYYQLGGQYLRVMGSGVFEGNWNYMSICNVGGDNNMFDPVQNKWGIEGKDVRYELLSNYFPCTFGIQNLQPTWTTQVVENLQTKSIAWGATFMLGLNQARVEKCPQKTAIFKAFRAWENSRSAHVFNQKLKEKMKPEKNRFHLEQIDANSWKLYPLLSSGGYGTPLILTRTK